MDRKLKQTFIALSLAAASLGTGLAQPPVAAAYAPSTPTMPADISISTRLPLISEPGFGTAQAGALASCDAGRNITVRLGSRLAISTSNRNGSYWYYATATAWFYHAEFNPTLKKNVWVYKSGATATTPPVWVPSTWDYEYPSGPFTFDGTQTMSAPGAWYVRITARFYHAGTYVGEQTLNLNSGADYTGSFRNSNGYCAF